MNHKALKWTTLELIAQIIAKHCNKWQFHVCNDIIHFGGGCTVSELKSILNKRYKGYCCTTVTFLLMEGNQEEGRRHWQNKRCWFLQLQAENVSKEQWLKVERSWNGEEACESGAWVKVSTSKKNSFLKNYEILCSSSEKILFEPVTIIHHFMCWEMLVIWGFVAFFFSLKLTSSFEALSLPYLPFTC